jgi:hypothetical protein
MTRGMCKGGHSKKVGPQDRANRHSSAVSNENLFLFPAGMQIDLESKLQGAILIMHVCFRPRPWCRQEPCGGRLV